MSDDHHGDSHMHITPVRTYLIAGGALYVLTVLTVAVAFFDFGAFNDLVALAIAGAKAAVIVIIFMHARHTTGVTRLAIFMGIIWLLIMILGIMDDYLTRSWIVPG